MADSSILTALRDATGDAHRALEIEADVEARLRDPACRPDMVARLLTLHEGAEAAFGRWGVDFARLGVPVADRTVILRRDAATLGATPRASGVGGPASLAEALGWAYVIEGSTLGGRVMLKRMIADGIDLTGLMHLDPHGDQTGPRWRAMIAALETFAVSDVLTVQLVRGARDAFAFAHRILAPRPDVEAA